MNGNGELGAGTVGGVLGDKNRQRWGGEGWKGDDMRMMCGDSDLLSVKTATDPSYLRSILDRRVETAA